MGCCNHHCIYYNSVFVRSMSDYILATGAPGSKWSGWIEKNLYTLEGIDTSDRSPEREYWNGQSMHRGAYFDPEMEYSNSRENWDKPFSGEGTRIIKSHTFAYSLNTLKDYGYPIYMVVRSSVDCFNWWHEAGGWNIEYPNYSWYVDDKNMMNQIVSQNESIWKFLIEHKDKVELIDGDLRENSDIFVYRYQSE